MISENYRNQQRIMHQDPKYGMAGGAFSPMVAGIMNKLKVKELLDYGCGHNLSLFEALKGKVEHKFKYQAYDPGVPEYEGVPVPSEMVACVDVLEHIEPEHLDAVLDELRRLTKQIGFFSVATGPAEKRLPDGRNAHLIVEQAEWWLPKFMDRFDLQSFQKIDLGAHKGFFVVVHPKMRDILLGLQ